jgi:hypothetical protein
MGKGEVLKMEFYHRKNQYYRQGRARKLGRKFFFQREISCSRWIKGRVYLHSQELGRVGRSGWASKHGRA